MICKYSATYQLLQQHLRLLETTGNQHVLTGALVGIEKESLRVTPAGTIANTPHPKALGAALTHPFITTDYSEALLEFITPPLSDKAALLNTLADSQRFVLQYLGEEILWAASMPCNVQGDCSVPIAYYGNSNAGTMKTVYRRGLGLRYGRVMQAIAGIHYNYSLPEAFWPLWQQLLASSLPLTSFIAESYMGMVRNIQRYGWLVPYLFGAAPAVCRSFIGNRATDLQIFDTNTLYYPYATSLRMGDIGYQNSLEAGKGFRANYDSLDAYIRSLSWAVTTPCPDYVKIGVIANGQYQQLNANLLQIENEHYSTIRPKQQLHWLEKPAIALRKRGIRYLELRSPDVNVFTPTGITVEQLYWLELLLLFCLFMPSPCITAQEAKEINRNQILVAHHGRDPTLQLYRRNMVIGLRTWACELQEEMTPLAALLDANIADKPYGHALAMAQERIDNPEATPSAQVLREMRAKSESFAELTLRLSKAHKVELLRLGPLTTERQAYFDNLAIASHKHQQALESEDRRPFEQFLAEYFNEENFHVISHHVQQYQA